MRWWPLLLVVGCTSKVDDSDDITIVGNPGEMTARLGWMSNVNATRATLAIDRIVWAPCAEVDDEGVTDGTTLDLLAGEALEVPPGCWSAFTVEVAGALEVEGTGSPAGEFALSLDVGDLAVPLIVPVEVDGSPFVFEVGKEGWLDGKYLALDTAVSLDLGPTDPISLALVDRMANGHRLYFDDDEDGEISPEERGNELGGTPGPYITHRLAAVGPGGAFAGSKDGGMDWFVDAPTTAADPETDLHGVAFGDAGFVAVGGETTGLYVRSLAATLGWVESSDAGPGLRGVTFGDRYVAVGLQGRRAHSSDGESWTDAVGNDGVTTFRDVAWGGGRYVAVGDGGARSTSPDGNAWTDQTGGEDLLAVAHGDGLFVAGGADGRVATSPDGSSWTDEAPLSGTVRGLAYGRDTWVAVGDGGAWTSTDGRSWTPVLLPDLEGVTYGAGAFLAVAADGVRYRSLFGDQWVALDVQALPVLADVVYGSSEDDGGD